VKPEMEIFGASMVEGGPALVRKGLSAAPAQSHFVLGLSPLPEAGTR